jgi:hypothetical protein
MEQTKETEMWSTNFAFNYNAIRPQGVNKLVDVSSLCGNAVW